MENNFLLTYSIPVLYEGISRINQYAWFESKEELNEFVKDKRKQYGNGFEINEAIEIKDDREIIID